MIYGTKFGDEMNSISIYIRSSVLIQKLLEMTKTSMYLNLKLI